MIYKSEVATAAAAASAAPRADSSQPWLQSALACSSGLCAAAGGLRDFTTSNAQPHLPIGWGPCHQCLAVEASAATLAWRALAWRAEASPWATGVAFSDAEGALRNLFRRMLRLGSPLDSSESYELDTGKVRWLWAPQTCVRDFVSQSDSERKGRTPNHRQKRRAM